MELFELRILELSRSPSTSLLCQNFKRVVHQLPTFPVEFADRLIKHLLHSTTLQADLQSSLLAELTL